MSALSANSPLQWPRGPRTGFKLSNEKGVYALFLHKGVILRGLEAGQEGLLYIGLAANKSGLKGRCHFNARTVNHSPRKSLSVLLLNELSLEPVLVAKPASSDTWGLDKASDSRLSAWMHANLELAVEICHNPDARESELVEHYAPPLNLTKCVQTAQHHMISVARSKVMAGLQRAC